MLRKACQNTIVKIAIKSIKLILRLASTKANKHRQTDKIIKNNCFSLFYVIKTLYGVRGFILQLY